MGVLRRMTEDLNVSLGVGALVLFVMAVGAFVLRSVR